MRSGPLLTSAALLLAACGGRASEPPARSPSLDYPPPDIQSSDGEVVGADRQAPRDKLQSGAHIGSDGIDSGGPGTKEPRGSKAAPEPCAEIGLEDSSGRPRCGPSAPPAGAK